MFFLVPGLARRAKAGPVTLVALLQRGSLRASDTQTFRGPGAAAREQGSRGPGVLTAACQDRVGEPELRVPWFSNAASCSG